MLSKKEFMSEKKEIEKYFNLDSTKKSNTLDRHTIKTKLGLYRFYFDIESKTIFGKFEYFKIENMPDRMQFCDKGIFTIKYYPSTTGKMNFHFNNVYDFIDTLDRIALENVA